MSAQTTNVNPFFTVSFDIPGQPPSVNALYAVDRFTHEWILKPEAIIWRRNAHPYIPSVQPLLKNLPLRFYMEVHRDWYYKKGTPVKADLSNLEKFVHDTVAKKLGFDDMWIWEKSSRKVHDVCWLGIRIEVSAYEVK